MTNMLIAWGSALLAQVPTPPAVDAAATVHIDSVWDFIIKGGPIMIPIGLCSLVALTIIVERLASLRRRNIIPPNFITELTESLGSGHGDRSKALSYCERHPGPLANLFAAGIKKLGEPVEVVERHIQSAGQREVIRLRKYLRALSVIAALSPLLGLLGTIFGMITAFQTVAASAEALGRTELLAKGIYEAMITTAAGLIVAIPTIVAFHWLNTKVDRLVLEMDELAVAFVEAHAEPRHGDNGRAAKVTLRADADVISSSGLSRTPAHVA